MLRPFWVTIMAYDIDKEIRIAVDTGKVKFGSRTAEKELLVGSPKLIIMASNLKLENAAEYQRLSGLSEIPVYQYGGTSLQLGSICGKPFPVSMLIVYEEGNSKIIVAASGKAEKSADTSSGRKKKKSK